MGAITIEPITMEGRHVRLEPLSRAHLDGLWDVAQAPELWEQTMARVRTREELAGYVEAALAAAAARTALPFATIDRASGRVAGSTRFMSVSLPDLRVDIGSTFLGLRYQRTALNTEAKYLMLRHAFERWGCVRVELKTAAANERSRAAIRRLGAKEEGILRRHGRLPDGTWRDTVYHGVLDSEWPAAKAELERRLAR